jgi:hypothetical protein
VVLHYPDRVLIVSVRDNGPGTPANPPMPGHGLLDVRERRRRGPIRIVVADDYASPSGYGRPAEAGLPSRSVRQ